MAKIFSKEWFGQILFGIALPSLQKYGETAAAKFAQKMFDDNPTETNQIAIGAYPIIDVQLEDYVKRTATKVDDDAVVALKKVFEDLAKNNGFTLPNLDEGTPND